MSAPYNVTMPTFELLEGQVYILRKSTTVLGQVSRVNPRSNTPSRKVARLGDTNKSTSLSPTEHTLSIEIYTEKDPNELALLLGGTTKPVSGGWVGTEKLFLNATVNPFDLAMDVYNTNTGVSGDVIQGTWTFKNFRPSSLNLNVQADAAATLTIDGEPNEIYYIPAAGIGA